MDIHRYKEQCDRNTKRIQESKEFSKENKKIVLGFKNYLLSENIGVAKINRYLQDIIRFNRMLGRTFSEATKEDIRRVVGELNQTSLSEETKKGIKIMIRKLYRFIEGVEEKGVYPDRVKWISIAIPNNHKKLPEELLTEDEISRMIQKCSCLRDKTFVAVLAESGGRIGEIATLKIKNVSFERYGARLTLSGKTGMRKILIINSSPYLQQWINNHPFSDNKESYLWIKDNGELLTDSRFSAILKKAGRMAGINKRIYPHLLRHSFATRISEIMSEASMKQYLGWGQSSKMCAVYIHMNGKSVDEAILRANGIEVSSVKKESQMKPLLCLKCKCINEFTNKFCKICGFPLNEKEAQEILKKETERSVADEVMNKLMDDEEILSLIKKKASLIKSS
jgi:site-specific recombinase XerD